MPFKTDHGRLTLGVSLLEDTSEWREWMSWIQTEHLDLLMLPVTTEEAPKSVEKATDFLPTTETDMCFDSSVWQNHVVLRCSSWISTHPDPLIASMALSAQIDWAQHCGARCVSVPLYPPVESSTGMNEISVESLVHSFAPLVTQLARKTSIPMILEIPWVFRCSKLIDGWEVWVHLKRLIGDAADSLGIGLWLPEPKDKRCTEEELIRLRRWKAENVRALFCDHFEYNEMKYPVLPPVYSMVMQMFTQRNCWMITMADDQELVKQKMAYFKFKFTQLPPLSQDDKDTLSYRDCLQQPLQPLADNLESVTYEVFETCPAKYTQYYLAIIEALKDLKIRKSNLHIAVVGGGRGPLMEKCFQAIQDMGMDCSSWKFTVVEKNQNAVKTLQHRVQADQNELWRRVEVVKSDMRFWKPSQPIDLLISELLGSFGDNELSPECLDGVEQHLSKDFAISIPTSYTSTLEPISASTLFWSAKNEHQKLDQPYVCKLWSYDTFSDEGPTDCFRFEHPLRQLQSNNVHNARYKHLSFRASYDAICHGFAGYFTSTLYKHIKCSIDPRDFTEGMISWFPLFFPLRNPLHLKENDRLDLFLWRKVDGRNVWYEWCADVPSGFKSSPLQNAEGHAYKIAS